MRRRHDAECRYYYRFAWGVLLLPSLLSQSRYGGTTTTATAFAWSTGTQWSAFHITRTSRLFENDHGGKNPIRFQRRIESVSSSSISLPAHGSNEPTTNNTLEHDNETAFNSFVTDVYNLATIRPPIPETDVSITSAILSGGSSYTRLWQPSTWDSHLIPPLQRYFKHVRRWNTSSLAKKILPAVMTSAIYSLVVAYTLRHLPFIGKWSLTKGASAAMASVTAPLALLLTLRTNASLVRLVEARYIWGEFVMHARSLAGLFASSVYHSDPRAVVLACRYLVMIGWSLKCEVRNEPRERWEVVVNAMLHGENEEEAMWLLRQPKKNVAITTRLRHLLTDIAKTIGASCEEGDVVNYRLQRQAMEGVIDQIESDVGGCARLLTSPIPPTYSRHLSRIMVMYLSLLPFGLVASGIPSLGTALASASISYMLIGIDEIGMEIENPFQLLPLQQLAGAIQTDVATQLLCVRDVPRTTAVPPLVEEEEELVTEIE